MKTNDFRKLSFLATPIDRDSAMTSISLNSEVCRKRVTRQMCFTLDQSFSMPAAFAGSTSIERRSMRPCAFWITPSNETRGKNRLVESRCDILP